MFLLNNRPVHAKYPANGYGAQGMVGAIMVSTLILIAGTAQAGTATGRGIFVSLIEKKPVLSSRQAMDDVVALARQARITVVFLQVYRANQAWFPSRVGDAAPYARALEAVGEDPVALFIRKAHAAGIEVHAWVNLLSLSTNTQAPLLKKYGCRILTRNVVAKKKLEDYKIDGQYFLEPGDPRVRKELEAMTGELLLRYPQLDGIQFDYIRYPDAKPAYGYTCANLERFRKVVRVMSFREATPAWQNWKRAQVTGLLRQLVARARAIHPDIHISTTGCMSYFRAYHEAFQDWPSWVNDGLVEFVSVMSYPDNVPDFIEQMAEVREHVVDFTKVNMCVGAYKFIKTPAIFGEQFSVCEQSGARACLVFYYGNLKDNPALAESLTLPHQSAERPRSRD